MFATPTNYFKRSTADKTGDQTYLEAEVCSRKAGHYYFASLLPLRSNVWVPISFQKYAQTYDFNLKPDLTNWTFTNSTNILSCTWLSFLSNWNQFQQEILFELWIQMPGYIVPPAMFQIKFCHTSWQHWNTLKAEDFLDPINTKAVHFKSLLTFPP